tara:strand:+ start:351 stop:494 length:144 start_codon:yes stop_codon:yes gene_type:complete
MDFIYFQSAVYNWQKYCQLFKNVKMSQNFVTIKDEKVNFQESWAVAH